MERSRNILSKIAASAAFPCFLSDFVITKGRSQFAAADNALVPGECLCPHNSDTTHSSARDPGEGSGDGSGSIAACMTLAICREPWLALVSYGAVWVLTVTLPHIWTGTSHRSPAFVITRGTWSHVTCWPHSHLVFSKLSASSNSPASYFKAIISSQTDCGLYVIMRCDVTATASPGM